MTIWYRTGTVTVTNGSKNVVGVDTTFNTSIYPGDLFTVDENVFYEVADVTSNLNFTLQRNYAGTTGSGEAYVVVPLSPKRQLTAELAARVNILIERYRGAIEAWTAGGWAVDTNGDYKVSGDTDRKLVPIENGGGGLGTATKRWGQVHTSALTIAGQVVSPKTSSTANSVPVANASGKIDAGWVPTASATVPGIIKVGSSLRMDGEVLSVDYDALHGVVHSGILGVQDTGLRGADGAGLIQVRVADGKLYPTIINESNLQHPSFHFPEFTDAGGNVFREIPIAYWWRGDLPDFYDGTTPRWTMLMSDTAGTVTINGVSCTFTASAGAFKRSGAWLTKFYYGKYRGSDDSGTKIASKPVQTHLGSVSFANWQTRCAAVGTGYHMVSLFEWQEILARMVVEKKTFQLFPESVRATQALCRWRGIEDMAYSGTVYVEWMDGVRTDANGKYELWSEAGGSYVTSGKTAFTYLGESTYYNQGVLTGTGFDSLFLAETLGEKATSFIPDLSGRGSGLVGCVCYSHFDSGHASYGAFGSEFRGVASSAHAGIGSRLAKW